MADYSRLTARGWRNGDDSTLQSRVGTSGWYQIALPVADETPPVLSAPDLAATSPTELTGTIVTTEAGPCWIVLYDAALGEPSGPQIRAGTDINGDPAVQHVNWQDFEIGSNEILFTGATGGTAYKFSAVQDDLADPANASNIITSASESTPSPDTENPVLSGSITVAAITSGTFSTTCPVGTDNVGVVGYDVREDGGAWIDNGTSRTHNHTGKTQLTAYDIDWRCRDAAGLPSNVLSLEVTTYRNGATAQFIIDNTAEVMGVQQKGALYELALTVDPDDWLSYYEVTPPTPSGGTLEPNADGSFSYIGPDGAIWVIQPEVNMVEEAETTIIELYDQDTYATPANSVGGATVGPSNATQTHPVTPAGAQGGATVSSSSTAQSNVATPANSNGGATVTAATVTQEAAVTPAGASAGATVTSTTARALSKARAASWTRYPSNNGRAPYPLQ